MARKKKAAPAADTPLPEGPSPEEQAMVDEEQRQIMARMKEQREAEEKAERENYAGKLQRAEERRATKMELENAVHALIDVCKDLNTRLAALEAK